MSIFEEYGACNGEPKRREKENKQWQNNRHTKEQQQRNRFGTVSGQTPRRRGMGLKQVLLVRNLILNSDATQN